MLLQTTQTQCQLLNSRYLSNDDQIGCIAYISSLIAKAYVTFEDAMEVKSNVEAAKRLVTHVKQTNLQSRLIKTFKQTVSTRFYRYREMIRCGTEAWEELEFLLDARNELK